MAEMKAMEFRDGLKLRLARRPVPEPQEGKNSKIWRIDPISKHACSGWSCDLLSSLITGSRIRCIGEPAQTFPQTEPIKAWPEG
jgi:hypothetical protein